MENNPHYRNKVKTTGVLLLGSGILFFVLGVVLGAKPALQPYLKLLQGVGVYLIFMGAWNLVKTYFYQKNPTALQRDRIGSIDERKTWIRYRSGNNAFIFDIAVAIIALLVVGVIQEPIDPDLAWWVLTGIVSGTLIIYAASLIWYESKY